ncbi:MAG: TonB-dependent receptor plug domain-containing protein [Chitinophagaceae bacterium]
MHFTKGFFVSSIILLISLQLTGQDTAVQMENVVITATQKAQQQKESGRNIISIKGETFSSSAVHSIDELLRYIPGIEIQQRGPQGAQSDIVIRGGTFQQVLVIIDGVKLNDPLTGHFNMNIPIHPSEIDRIEILKGAASAIWGSEAVGGVVNIITKTFSGSANKNSITAKAVIGQYKLLNGDAWFNWSKKNSTLSGGVITNNSTGQLLRGTNGFFHLTTANISYSQKFAKDLKLNFRSAIDFRNFNAQNFYTTFASDTANEEVNTWWNHLNLTKKTNKSQINFDAAYKKLRDQYWFRPVSVPNDNKSNIFTSQLNYTSQLNKMHNYTIGLQTLRKEINSNDRGDHSLWHGAVYTIFRHKPGKDIFLHESVRLDWDESYGVVFLPQVNIAWSPSKITIRASAGKSFRDADFTERFNNYNKSLVTSGRIGNPNLQPEQSWNAELGADINFTNQFRISGTLFYRTHNNLIDWANTLYTDMPRKENLIPTGTYALAKNVENVKTTGAEIDILYSKNFSTKSNLTATLGLTVLQSKNDDPVPSFYISSHAKCLVNFSSVYKWEKFIFSANVLYKKRDTQKSAAINAEITSSYFLLNAKVGYCLFAKTGNLFLQSDNLFDKKYSDLLGSIMPGRWLSVGFEIAL